MAQAMNMSVKRKARYDRKIEREQDKREEEKKKYIERQQRGEKPIPRAMGTILQEKLQNIWGRYVYVGERLQDDSKEHLPEGHKKRRPLQSGPRNVIQMTLNIDKLSCYNVPGMLNANMCRVRTMRKATTAQVSNA